MTKSEVVDLIIDSFVIGAIVYNIVCLVYHYFKQKNLICYEGSITISNIEARNKLRRKLLSHGLLVCSMTLLSFYMCFSLSWFWFLTFSLIGSYCIHYWLSNIFGDIIEYSSLPEINNFGLYLRSFSSDNDKEKHNLEKWIAKRFSSVCRLFSIGNPHNIFNIQGATVIYATDNDWKNVISDLMDKSTYIILRLHDSEGTQWELDTCFELGHEHKTIFILDTEEKLESLSIRLQNKFNQKLTIPNNVLYPLALSLSNTESCKIDIIPLKQSSDVDNLFQYCVTHNKTVSKEELQYIDNRSNIIMRLFHKKNFPNEIGWFDWGLIINPYMYILYNRWPLWIIVSPIIIEGLALFINKHFLYSAPWIPFATMLLWIYCIAFFIIILIFPKRISWLSRNWPSTEWFEYENFKIRRSMLWMTLSMIWYFFWIQVIIYFVTGWWIQLK